MSICLFSTREQKCSGYSNTATCSQLGCLTVTPLEKNPVHQVAWFFCGMLSETENPPRCWSQPRGWRTLFGVASHA